MKKGINLEQFEKYILEQFGKRCKEYGIGCFICIAWRLFDDLKALMEF